MTQPAQLSLFDDNGQTIAEAAQIGYATAMVKRARRRASDRRATRIAVDDLPDENSRLPDGLINAGRWDDQQRFEANIAAIEALDTTDEGISLDENTRNALAGYVGWGGLAWAIDTRSPTYSFYRWRERRDQINAVTDDAEREALRASVLTAYYTSESLIDAIWSGVRRLGFTGGRVLEPAAGIGHFIGRRPADLPMEWTAIECEPIAARIAERLYPSAAVYSDRYEDTRLADDSFDLAISNVPFGDFGITDPTYTGGRFKSLRIHDYYFLKTLDKVRPGGLIAFVTSRGTLDKTDERVRRQIAKHAVLHGAFRLPSSAFINSAGTSVTADVLYLQKRETPLLGEPDTEDWLVSAFDMRSSVAQNRYYRAHPSHVLGQPRVASGQYGPTLKVDDSEATDYGTMARLLPDAVYVPAEDAIEKAIEPRIELGPRDGLSARQVGAYTITDNGEIAVIEADGSLSAAGLSKTAAKRVELLLPVRDAAYEVIGAQVRGEDDLSLHTAQAHLHRAYDAMVKRYGPISKPANRRAMSADPALPLLLSLEDYDDKNQTAAKTEIFTRRTIGQPEAVETCETAADALAVCLNEHGAVVPDRMCALLDQEWSDIRESLGDQIYRDPVRGHWVTSSEYLSGNVVRKLAAAEQACANDHSYEPNVEALRAIQPEPLGAGEIDVNLGAPWVPSWVYHRFAGQLLNMVINPNTRANLRKPTFQQVPSGSLGYTSSIGLWELRIPDHACDQAAVARWGTPDFTPARLLEHGLNQKLPAVWYTDYEGKRHKDQDASNEAQEKLAEIKDAFALWLWEDAERAEYLCGLYNDRFNNRVEREYNGSHLTFPGMSIARTLRTHQANFAWRVVVSGNTYAAHVVGSGKTGSLVAAAMENKRLGLARKPLIVVPNNLLYDFAAEALRFYPAANVLIARKEDVSKQGRRQFLAKVSSRNWDLIIMTHESFGRIPLSDRCVRRFIGDEIAEYNDLITAIEADGGERLTLKNLEAAKRRLKTRLENLSDADDRDHGGMYFEALGVDMLMVDEAHLFKNLEIKTRMGAIPGVTNAASKRAFDLFMKARWIGEQSSSEQRNVVFASGTPISNSMTEIYTNLKYLAPMLCDEHDIAHFDSWAAAFGEVVTGLERAPDSNGYRINQRFAHFINVPELTRLFREVADVKMAEDLDLPVPEADRQHHVCEPSQAQRDYIKALGERARACRDGRIDKRVDNILKIANDGRHASLDIRLVDPAANDHPESKARRVAQTVRQHYEDGGDNVQLVFCDISTPRKNRFSIYIEIRELLIAAGIPADEIAFAQDYNTDAERQRLYAAARAGQIRVLLGSTPKMGMGMNAQDKISDLHHIDAPWRPADIEQRDGRAIRQGNQHAIVRVHTYVTRDCFDEFMWETLKRKAGFIKQALTSPDKAQRRIVDTIEPKYAEIMALASGDPRVREKVEIDDKVDRLKLKYRYHRNTQARIERQLQKTIKLLDSARDRLPRLVQDRDAATTDWSLHLPNGQAVTDGMAIDKIIHKLGKQARASGSDRAHIGQMSGFDWFITPADFYGFKGYELVRTGTSNCTSYLGRSVKGAHAEMRATIEELPTLIVRAREKIAALDQEREGLVTQQGRPFAEQAELETAMARQKELNRELTELADKQTNTKAAA